MKISQRILILILINIVALLCMATVISFISADEQNFFSQSNKIMEFKYVLAEKRQQEMLLYQDLLDSRELDNLSFTLIKTFKEIDITLLTSNQDQHYKIETLLDTREEIFNNIMFIYSSFKTQQSKIQTYSTIFKLKSGELNEQLETQVSKTDNINLIRLFSVNRESTAAIDRFLYLISNIDLSSESIADSLDYIYLQLVDLQRVTESYSDDSYTYIAGEMESLFNELVDNSNNLIELKKENYRLTEELIETDDHIFLITDSIKNDSIAMLNRREDQELFALVSGLLFITLFSITTTALLGNSITRPIEELRSYVLSIDPTDIQKHGSRKLENKIDSRKHTEIYQLAESYFNLENTLFTKMSELHDRSENLSLELKERKKTEKKLKKTETYLNNIIQSLKSIIITSDNDFKLIHYNKLAEELAMGHKKTLYEQFPFLVSFKDEISNTLDKSEPYFEQAIKIESLNDRYFNLSMNPLAGEKTEGIVIRLDDVTSLKNIENQLIQTQKWETLGVLTSGFAHDFNNVLTGIVTSSSILLHKAKKQYPDLDNPFMDCLNIIDKSGQRAAAMVQQLLSLSKNNELDFSNIDLNNSVRDIKSICQNSFDKSISIETELLGEHIPVKADGVQIEQSILNLCINAYHSMTEMRDRNDKQGGILGIVMKKVHIDCFCVHEDKNREPGDYISIAISDTGVGISREQKKKIFDPFYTTKDKSKGTGLGLTMVQHIINQHKGFIELYSEPGRGTVIRVFLPVSTELDPVSHTRESKRVLIKGKGTILVIDDEEIIRVLSESILKECGYETLTAVDGYKGVDIYKEKRNKIELVILDMSMPGISGKETFIEIKQINPEQKILMSSGFVKDDRIQDLINMGLEDFIQKPFDYIELSEKVSSIISG